MGKQFAEVTSETVRVQRLSAADAIIASDSAWHSLGAYMGGMLLQGGGVIISLVMLKRKDFRKITAFSGLIGNALDLGQHRIYFYWQKNPKKVYLLL